MKVSQPGSIVPSVVAFSVGASGRKNKCNLRVLTGSLGKVGWRGAPGMGIIHYHHGNYKPGLFNGHQRPVERF